MAQATCNVSKGRANELHLRAKNGDPANAAVVIVAIVSTDPIDSLKDADTLSALLALPATAEATNTGYARKTLSGVDLNALVLDDTGNTQKAGFAFDQQWNTVLAGDDWTHLVFCYDSDTLAGTDADLVPMTVNDFAVVADGNNIVLAAGDYFSAGE